MTAPPPVLSPSNILPPSLLTALSITQEEIAMRASDLSLQQYAFLKLFNGKVH
jgi:hypothetical protein